MATEVSHLAEMVNLHSDTIPAQLDRICSVRPAQPVTVFVNQSVKYRTIRLQAARGRSGPQISTQT
jgi:hypothetical protein